MEANFLEMYKFAYSASTYNELQEEIKMMCEFACIIGYPLEAYLFDDRKKAYKECVDIERKFHVDVKFKKTLLEFDENLLNSED